MPNLAFSPRHLRDRRIAAGWKRPVLAERAGVRPSTILAYESGQTVPSVPAVCRLAGALGCPLAALFEIAQEAERHAA